MRNFILTSVVLTIVVGVVQGDWFTDKLCDAEYQAYQSCASTQAPASCATQESALLTCIRPIQCQICEDAVQTYHDFYPCAGGFLDWGSGLDSNIKGCQQPVFDCSKVQGSLATECEAVVAKIKEPDAWKALYRSLARDAEPYLACSSVRSISCPVDPNFSSGQLSPCHAALKSSACENDFRCTAVTARGSDGNPTCTTECYLCYWIAKSFPLFQETCKEPSLAAAVGPGVAASTTPPAANAGGTNTPGGATTPTTTNTPASRTTFMQLQEEQQRQDQQQQQQFLEEQEQQQQQPQQAIHSVHRHVGSRSQREGRDSSFTSSNSNERIHRQQQPSPPRFDMYNSPLLFLEENEHVVNHQQQQQPPSFPSHSSRDIPSFSRMGPVAHQSIRVRKPNSQEQNSLSPSSPSRTLLTTSHLLYDDNRNNHDNNGADDILVEESASVRISAEHPAQQPSNEDVLQTILLDGKREAQILAQNVGARSGAGAPPLAVAGRHNVRHRRDDDQANNAAVTDAVSSIQEADRDGGDASLPPSSQNLAAGLLQAVINKAAHHDDGGGYGGDETSFLETHIHARTNQQPGATRTPSATSATPTRTFRADDGVPRKHNVAGLSMPDACLKMYDYVRQSRKARYFASYDRYVNVLSDVKDRLLGYMWDANVVCKCLGHCEVKPLENLSLLEACRYDQRDEDVMTYMLEINDHST